MFLEPRREPDAVVDVRQAERPAEPRPAAARDHAADARAAVHGTATEDLDAHEPEGQDDLLRLDTTEQVHDVPDEEVALIGGAQICSRLPGGEGPSELVDRLELRLLLLLAVRVVVRQAAEPCSPWRSRSAPGT